MEAKVVEDVLPPGGMWATLWTTFAEDGKEGFTGETLGVHAGEVAQPTEATGTKKRFHGDQAAGFTHGFVGDIAVGGIGDAQHVSGTAHLKGLETADVDDLGSPGFRTPEKGGKDSGFEHRDFG